VSVRVILPAGLRDLAGIVGEVQVEPKGAVTRAHVLDALEQDYPMLRGTIRDRRSLKRRPYVRFFACEQDFSLRPDDELLPGAVAEGAEPFLVVGAIAGG
jgi:sulfur-carrier protein